MNWFLIWRVKKLNKVVDIVGDNMENSIGLSIPLVENHRIGTIG